MNYYNLQQNALSSCEEMRSTLPIADQNGPVVCPKPRRVGALMNMPVQPLRLNLSQLSEESESKAGAELLDIIHNRESSGEEFANQIASSPYFIGSPPARATNPLAQDARFGEEERLLIPTFSPPSGLLSPSSLSCKGGCARMKFGHRPAAVRVEGFDCLSRDRQNSGITAVA
uniref:Uncharacterized protein n=1 Tax=Lotus japonicus TaxID=34305 RepID=I3SF06_LOTJA|nr:unknown [Lotus japonicus]